MKFTLAAPADFEFAEAVCSHGFFVLAPNHWDPRTRTLETAVAFGDKTAVHVRVTEPQARRGIAVHVTGNPTGARIAVEAAIRRMLRLDEDLGPFHKLCAQRPSHERAADRKFGRLLRSPTLFEDIVKVICTCNIAWRQTVAMVERLVARCGVPCEAANDRKAFPTAARLARISTATLRETCSLGYRAEYIVNLAKAVAGGELDLDAFEARSGDTESTVRQLRQIRGIGPYAAANICMLLGRYDQLAYDTEMVRFLEDRTGRKPSRRSVEQRYRRWRPYQFLAYWWELWSDYADRHGPADQWLQNTVGAQITAQPKTTRPRTRRGSSPTPPANPAAPSRSTAR